MKFSDITTFFKYKDNIYLKISPASICERSTGAVFMANAINFRTRKPEFFTDETNVEEIDNI